MGPTPWGLGPRALLGGRSCCTGRRRLSRRCCLTEDASLAKLETLRKAEAMARRPQKTCWDPLHRGTYGSPALSHHLPWGACPLRGMEDRASALCLGSSPLQQLWVTANSPPGTVLARDQPRSSEQPLQAAGLVDRGSSPPKPLEKGTPWAWRAPKAK